MYKDLVAYQLALPITSLTWQFLNLYIPKTSRTYDQMEQALRSGKQNIVEGSLEKSLKSNIKLTGVARASFEELLEDLKDFLLSHNLPIWNKTDPRVLRVRAVRVNPSNSTNLSNLTNWTNLINLPSSPESHANLLITLISLETYLLDQLLRKLEKNFVEEGGYSENLTLKRKEYKAKDPRYSPRKTKCQIWKLKI